MKFLALDIGGANIKIADGEGFAATYPFPLWRETPKLAQQLRTIISENPACDHLLVTMTGELADCFADKAEGVKYILAAVEKAADNRHTRVYLCDGRMVTPQVAGAQPRLAAASNWHALAQFAGRYAPDETAIVIDMGSTTTDIIPLFRGRPGAVGNTDSQRLVSGELVYTGVLRTPVCALVDHVPYRHQSCGVAAELFATTYDVYLLLDLVEENPASHHTADGRPATKAAARARLGRVIAADVEEFNHRDAVALAQAVFEAQVRKIVTATKQVGKRCTPTPTTLIFSGHGEFVLRKSLEDLPPVNNVVSLSDKLGPLVSRCAPAHALAVLAREGAGL